MYHKYFKDAYFDNYHKRISRNILILLSVGLLCIFILGCSKVESQDQNEKVIRTILEHDFNAPDNEVIRLSNDYSIKLKEGPIDPEKDPYSKYLKTKYEPYFTDSGYDRFIVHNALLFHLAAYKNDYRIRVDEIVVEKSENMSMLYYFTVYVDYENDEGKKEKIEIPGQVAFREDKIEKVTYYNDGGLIMIDSEGK